MIPPFVFPQGFRALLVAAGTVACLTATVPVGSAAEPPDSLPATLPELPWHLTARPWRPLGTTRGELLDALEAALVAMVPLQYWNERDASDPRNGAIIDPFDRKELQYGTPLFAFNAAVLMGEGRAFGLAEPAARALDRATCDISDGPATDWHGEFFTAPMVKAMRIFAGLRGRHPAFTEARFEAWNARMKARRDAFMNMKVKQNWRTFAMKGEWLRQQDGHIRDGVDWIEANWNRPEEGDQRGRFRRDLDVHTMDPHFFLYHDDTADPETFAYNGATTANLLDMLENGYDGPSAGEMREIISRNLRASLLMLGASGEAPAGGRTGEHIWDDSIYANAFELMAGVAQRGGDPRLAGQYHRAALRLLASHARFRQENGWFSITKNRFPAYLKNRYASWSGVANYEGFTLACCAETLLAWKSEIPEQATPSEIGGYAMKLAPSFANVFVNAGGMQAQICTRGETDNYGGVQWHTLGITRFSRSGWDGRHGPGAGHVNPDFSDGFSFSPVFLEDGRWKRVCLEPKRFHGSFRAEFVHPLLVRGVLAIAPVAGARGPSFEMRMTLTPDGVLVDTLRTSGDQPYGVVWPLMESDGRQRLETRIGKDIASTTGPRSDGPARKIAVGATTATAPGVWSWSGVDGGKGGTAVVGFDYTLEGDRKSVRQARLTVNGHPQPAMGFHPTGGKRFPHVIEAPVPLEAGGRNTITLEIEGGAGLHLGGLRVRRPEPTAPEPDQQNFLAVGGPVRIDASAPVVRGGYGDFHPLHVSAVDGGPVATFVYPRGVGDPPADAVRAGFQRHDGGFSSMLGRVDGTRYTGRTAAGGLGRGADLDGDGGDDVVFDRECAFILQLDRGRVTAVETDRPVVMTLGGRRFDLRAFTPLRPEGG